MKQAKRHMGQKVYSTEGVDSINVDSAGNVGIGTASPATKLDVNGGMQLSGSASGYPGGELRLGPTTASTDSAISTQSTGSPAMFFDHRGTSNTGYFVWRAGTGGGTERMRIDASGNLTHGSTGTFTSASFYGAMRLQNATVPNAPNQGTLLLSSGNFRVNGGLDYLGVQVIANANGVVLSTNATSWSPISSDERKKKDFEPTQGLEAVLKIEPVKYHYKTDEADAVKRLGFTAQNIATAIPEMAIPNGEKAEDGSDYLTIIPDYLLPVLVNAVKELKAELDETKAELAALKAK